MFHCNWIRQQLYAVIRMPDRCSCPLRTDSAPAIPSAHANGVNEQERLQVGQKADQSVEADARTKTYARDRPDVYYLAGGLSYSITHMHALFGRQNHRFSGCCSTVLCYLAKPGRWAKPLYAKLDQGKQMNSHVHHKPSQVLRPSTPMTGSRRQQRTEGRQWHADEQQLLRGPSTQRLQDSPNTMDVPSMVRISRAI